MIKRWLKRIGVLFLVILVAGAAFNAWRSFVDEGRYPAPGRMVQVGDHRLHMHCEGSGGPAVVLEAGAGSSSLYFRRIQKKLAQSVRVCSYDRAGLGWSESGSGQLDIGTSARELHDLLRASGEKLPVVLVGHSLGGNIAAYYATHYPRDVAGVVMIDPGTHEDMMEDFEGSEDEARRIATCGWKCGAAATAAHLGVVRLVARKAGTKHLSEAENAFYRAEIARPHTVSTVVGTLTFLPKSALQTRESRAFGDVPVTAICSAARKPQGKETPADVLKWHAQTLDRMRAWVSGSRDGRGPIVVPGSNHLSVGLTEPGISTIASETLRLVRAAPHQLHQNLGRRSGLEPRRHVAGVRRMARRGEADDYRRRTRGRHQPAQHRDDRRSGVAARVAGREAHRVPLAKTRSTSSTRAVQTGIAFRRD